VLLLIDELGGGYDYGKERRRNIPSIVSKNGEFAKACTRTELGSILYIDTLFLARLSVLARSRGLFFLG
jgi:hypothetical protein